METRIAVIGIIIENPEAVERLNAILHEYSSYILGRMGIPHQKRNLSIISIVIDAPPECHQRPLRKTGHDPQCPYENRLFKSITIPGDLYD